jgi:hypothetical protein
MTLNSLPKLLLIPLWLLALAPFRIFAEEPLIGLPSEAGVLALSNLPSLGFTTEAYQHEALRVLIEEANRVARELHLAERLPITESNLTEIYISPPAMMRLGRISTSNYVYYASVGRMFSGLEQRVEATTWGRIMAAHHWPISRLDTNRAFQVATQIMLAVGMDVSAMNRDCNIDIYVPMPEGARGKHFIPDYWVHWKKPGSLGAHVEYFEPTKTIHQLHVWDPKYILRKAAWTSNLAELLCQTNALVQTNAPAKP